MAHYRLSTRDREILGILELDADLSFVHVAKLLKTTVGSVHRSFQRLCERGVIVGRTALLDTSVIGLIEYGMSFALAPRSKGEREAFLQHMRRLPQLSWLAEVAGNYDVMCNVLASHPQQLHDFLDSVEAPFPHLITKRELVQRTTRIRYYRQYLYPSRKGPRTRAGDGKSAIQLSQNEQIVLRALDALKFESNRELAKMSKMPESTFNRIVRGLREKQVLLGFALRFNTDFLGVQQFRILLRCHYLSPQKRKAFELAVGNIPGAKLLLRCLGSWDYEIEFDATTPLAPRELSTTLWEKFHQELESIGIIPLLRHLKYISFRPNTL